MGLYEVCERAVGDLSRGGRRVSGDKGEAASRRLNKDDSAGDWTIAEQRRLRLKTIDWTKVELP